MAAPVSPRRLPRAERERQILDVAHARFARDGYSAVTMEDVAAEVGVTKPLLYAYWGNKEQLFLAALERDADRLFEVVAKSVAEDPQPADALRTAIGAFFGFVGAERDGFRVLFDETIPASGVVALKVAEYRQRITDTVAQTLLAEMSAKQRKAARVEVEALSHALLGAAEALARWWLRSGESEISPEEAAALLIETVEPGLRMRSAPSKEKT